MRDVEPIGRPLEEGSVNTVLLIAAGNLFVAGIANTRITAVDRVQLSMDMQDTREMILVARGVQYEITEGTLTCSDGQRLVRPRVSTST